ncbi:xanthine dehydrogenase accessory protein XdhC [Deinococcus ruber]|uniref:Xanthine dehydrogenase accessory protein XdhC n=1 Tax=Deinococcus ruber TaxID=1848197 RepID=A0A918CC12_9DEIO|nr:xanthine dehydrogenase accessory protein XdhC [Deinococcus ruber]GGR13652.1 xanthine dehydrogenase accessory protein XdhC [Deinococcus ruber]
MLITLVSVRGHAPRAAGAKMVVSETQTWDSVGGGNLEATAVQRARDLMAAGVQMPELLTLRLTDSAANDYGRQCCGGEVTVLLEPLATVRPHIALFGIGHVGLELALMLSRLDIHLHLADSRAAQLAPERLTGLEGSRARVHLHHSPIPELTLPELPAGSLVVIMTHDHAEDAALCDAALRRPELGFVGLIGSSVKWRRFREQLKAVGHTEDDLKRVSTPIGIPGISGKSPAVIALSVAAQLVQTLEGQQSAAPHTRLMTGTPHPAKRDT